jgi:hypothetical protein
VKATPFAFTSGEDGDAHGRALAFVFSLLVPAIFVISAIAEPSVETRGAIIAHWSRGVAAI